MCDEPLLSFGDDTIAAINQLEISRLISNISQKENVNVKNISQNSNLSLKHPADLHSSLLPVEKSTNREHHSDLNIPSDKNVSQLCTQQKCELSMWGLPSPVLQQYETHGIKTMFSWQVECLSDADVLEGRNLVYSAPTSAGKTLVAELLTIKAVLEKKKKAVIILPFVSVVREKMFYLKSLLETSGVRVEGLMGGHNVRGGIKNVDIAVCTIEKANGLINRLMEEDSLHRLGIVVVDELHLLGDPFRGYLLELLITKIRYMSTMNEDINIQLVGMSATLPNLDLLASWLDARLYKTDFRPIPLNEYLKVGPTVYTKNLEVKRIVDLKYNIQDDSEHVIYLCLETILNGHSSLIFCPTKNWCEKLAVSIAKEFFNIGNSGSDIGLKLRDQLKSDAIAEALEQLKTCPVGLDNALAKSIAFGVAFHHAGLTIDERDIIEGLFRSGVIRVLTATSTLSSGVNLPARRVLIRTPMFHRRPLDIQVYKQMVGRAGRMGKDTEGESFLLCNKSEQKVGEQLIQDDLKPIMSCLGHGELSSSLKRAILEVIASGVAETPEQVKCYTNCTLLATSHTGLENPIECCIKFLLENECIRLQLSEDNVTKYVPTPLGNACLAASMSPDDGLELFQELQKARQCFVLENELHLIYLVTPYSVSAQWGNLDWLQIMSLWEKLAPSMQRVGNLVGVDDAFMVRALRGTVNLRNYKQLHKLSVHRRFYTALALQELVNEVPLIEVASKFQCSKGMLQSLQQTSATFAGMVTAFCKRLGWRNLELLVSQFQDRLQFGVHRELCELMRLDLLNGPRARALFNAGIKSLGDLASADICQVEDALHKSVVFQTSKEMEGETAYDAAYRNQLKTIWITGREGLTEREAAALLVKEARTWLQQELGLVDVKWGNDNDESSSSNSSELKSDTSTHNEDTNCSEVEDTGNNCSERNDAEKQSLHSESENEEVENIFECLTSQDHDAREDDKENDFDKSSSSSCAKSGLKHFSLLDNNKKVDLNKLDGVRSDTKMNNTIKETQSFDCDSDDENPMASPNHHSNRMSPAMSPMDDIFDTSQEDTELNTGVMISRNSSISVQEGDVTEPLVNTAFMTTTIISSPDIVVLSTSDSQKAINISSNECNTPVLAVATDTDENNLMSNNVCSSRYSLDVFASPIPVTCKSPTIFEDSLVIDSYLGNLLDVPEVNDKGSLIVFEKENENFEGINNIANVGLTTHKNVGVKEDIKLSKGLVVPVQVDDPLPNQASKEQTSGDGEENDLHGEVNSLLTKRNQHILRLNKSNVENDIRKETLENHENGKNMVPTSSDTDGLTESFLKQAFTTICDFGNGGDSFLAKPLVKCKVNVGENIYSFNKSHHASGNSLCNPKEKEELNLSNKKSVRVPSVVKLPDKMKIAPTVQGYENVPSNTICTEAENGNLKDTRSVGTRLTFVSDSDEDENDLVPSSQSQSETSSYHSSSCDNVTWRKKKRKDKKQSLLKRKRTEDREVFKLPDRDVIDSVTKRIKTQNNASWDSFNVIDISIERAKFKEFTEKLKTCSHVAFSVASETWDNEAPKQSIGDRVIGKKSKKIGNIKRLLVDDKCCVVGVATCLGDKDAYYIALDPTSKGDASQGPLSFGEQLDLVERLMTRGEYFLSAFDIKEQYKVLYNSCSVNIDKEVYDPKVADWLFDAECDEKGLRSLMTKYLPSSLKLMKRVGNITGKYSLGLHFKSSVRARMRASVEAVITWHLISVQLKKLEECKLLKVFKEVEMPTILCLARMEVYGVGFCRDEAEKLHTLLQKQLTDLEKEAFKLAHHSFSLSSPNDVSKVLFKELQLKIQRYTSTHKPSTNKDVLIKLKNDHPLPSVILEWRKINFIMSKIILPFLKVGISERIFGCYETHTLTGRVTMREPNLQSIPRDFDVSLKEGESMTVSMRVAFVAKTGKSFVSADYSQLELRLLAHLSQDKILLDILKSGGDVFKSVAATWNKITEEEVTDNLRQRAKQVCYGVIYGIGANALSEQLEVDEEDATLFMKTFLNTYPCLNIYRQNVIRNCREKGYVETLSGRKRFLPLINSDKSHLKAQAERQAVNTTIQGSAADIAKTGMVLVEASLKAAFQNESPRVRRLRENKRQCIETSTATLVLHLHDELLYEVCDEYVDEVIHIIKGGMEAAANLTVPLPVRVKCGKSWGMLEEVI